MPNYDQLFDELDSMTRASSGSSANEEYWRKRLANQGELRAPPPKSLWRTFIDSFTPGGAAEETMRRGPAGFITSYVAPLVPTGEGKTYTERRKILAAKEKQRREGYDIVSAPKNVGEFVAELPASIAGSLISDPTNLITGGAETIVGKALTAAGIGGAADVALQGGEIASDLRDKYSPLQTGINVAAGPVFVAGAHGLGKAWDRFGPKRAQEDTNFVPDEDPIDRRIRGLDDLANHPDTPKHEAAAARRMAEKLRTKYGRPGQPIIEDFDFRSPEVREPLGIEDVASFGKRFGTVTSTKRSAARNKAVGGVPNSYHLSGRAMDIARKKGVSHKAIETALRAAGYNIVESIDEGDHSHFAFDFKKSVPVQQPDGLDDIRLVQDELPAIDEMARVNEALFQQADDTVIPFPREKLPELTDDELRDILSKQGQDDFADVLTPAERQDMDASWPYPPRFRDAYSNDIIDSIVGQGRATTTPVNDLGINPETAKRNFDQAVLKIADENKLTKEQVSAYVDTLPDDHPFIKRFFQILKDMLNDTSGSYRPGGTPPPTEPPNPLAVRLTDAVRLAEKAGKERRKQIREARKERFGEAFGRSKYTSGVEGLKAEKAALKGPLSEAELTPIRNQFTQAEIDEMLETIKSSDLLSYGENLTARDALDGLMDGRIPTETELEHLYQVFPDLVKEILKKKMSGRDKLVDIALKLYETRRAAMASGDISFLGRQGGSMWTRPAYWKTAKEQFAALSPTNGNEVLKQQRRDIVSNRHYSRAKEAGIELMGLGPIGSREEFAPSTFAEYIPGVGTVVNASNRSYTYSANGIRFGVLYDFLDKAERAGLDIDDPKLLKFAGRWVRLFTGRGGLPIIKGMNLDRAMPFLNLLLFAPRFTIATATRFGFLADPRVPWAVRKEALRDTSAYFLGMAGVLTAAVMAGAEVETDVRSPVGFKIKAGNLTLDPGQGILQTARMIATIATEEKVSGSGKKIPTNTGEFGNENDWDVLMRFIRTKLHPTLSGPIDVKEGRNVVGEKVDAKTEAIKSVLPLPTLNVAEVMSEDPVLATEVLPLILYGWGAQIYDPEARKRERKEERESKKKEADPLDELFKDLEKETNTSDLDKMFKELEQ